MNRLRPISYVRILASLIALLAILLPPVCFFLVEFHHAAGMVEAEAHIGASLVTRLIGQNPDYWQYEQIRLHELIARQISPDDFVVISNAAGDPVFILGSPPAAPASEHRSELHDAGVAAGMISISRSLRHVLVNSVLVLLACLPLGFAVLYAGWMVPARAIRHAEQLRDQSEHIMRKTLQLSSSGVIITTMEEGIVIEIDDTLLQLTGYTRDEVIGHSVLDLGVWRFPSQREALLRHLDEHGSLHDQQVPFITKYGDKLVLRCSTERITLDGKPHMLTVTEDITHLVHTFETQQELKGRLDRAEKMSEIGMLAGGVAHDLNNIFSGLVSYPDLLLSQLPEESHLRQPIAAIKRSGEFAAALVQDLLTLARRGIPDEKIVRIDQLVRDYLESLEHRNLRERYPAVEIHTHLADDILPVRGSGVRLTKVIMNLLVNAAEAVGNKGAIHLTVRNSYIEPQNTAHKELPEGAYVLLNVSDTGVGIAEDQIGHIFEPFYSSKKPGRSGTGLGLAVVNGVVKDHKGLIEVESVPGKGTSFSIYLPAAKYDANRFVTQQEKEQMGSRGEHILVVDDIQEQCDIVRLMLTALDYTVDVALGGEAALAILRSKPVDLVILDMIMPPGMNGLETFRQIRLLYPEQRVIFISGIEDSDEMQQALAEGAGCCIKKPYLLQDLGLAVRAELDRGRPRSGTVAASSESLPFNKQ